MMPNPRSRLALLLTLLVALATQLAGCGPELGEDRSSSTDEGLRSRAIVTVQGSGRTAWVAFGSVTWTGRTR